MGLGSEGSRWPAKPLHTAGTWDLHRPWLSLGHLCPELHRDTGVTPGVVR